MASKPTGDEAGADAELDDRRSDDPCGEIVGEAIASSFAAAGFVVDVGDTIE